VRVLWRAPPPWPPPPDRRTDYDGSPSVGRTAHTVLPFGCRAMPQLVLSPRGGPVRALHLHLPVGPSTSGHVRRQLRRWLQQVGWPGEHAEDPGARGGRSGQQRGRTRLHHPGYRLLVLSVLLSTRIKADIAVAAASELTDAGMGTAKGMLDASWQDRVDALGRAHYKRYDESIATYRARRRRRQDDRPRAQQPALHPRP
jgi:hypothetical protein